MAKGKAVGSLRWDMVADASGLVSGLRKGVNEVEKARRKMHRSQLSENWGDRGRRLGIRFGGRRGGRFGQRVGRFGGGIVSAVSKAGPALAAFAATAGVAVAAMERVTKANNELFLSTAEIIRGRGMSFREGAALQRAQADPFARGLDFALGGRGLPGEEQEKAAVKALESERRLNETRAEAMKAWAKQSAALMDMINDLKGSAYDGLTWVGKWVSAFDEWSKIMWQITPSLSLSMAERMGAAEEEWKSQLEAGRLSERAKALKAQQGMQIGSQTSAGQGSREEYQFFVRRQQRVRNEEIRMAAERNILLKEISEKLGRERSSVTGEIPYVSGV